MESTILQLICGFINISLSSNPVKILHCRRRMKRSRKSPDAVSTSAHVPDRDSSLGTEYEVFLSFRGPDTGHSFTDILYHVLVGAGVLVFRDNEEIRTGEKIGDEIVHAIKCSKVYMPILSRNYAASAWCLRELTLMLECTSKATDKVILPIFYDVTPDDVDFKDDVKHKSLYLDDLEKHKKKFGHDCVQQWKEALMEFGWIEGWNVQGKGHGEIIYSVVSKVLTKLTKVMMPLPSQLVGIDDHMRDFMKLLRKGPCDVPYLVIHGIGGIGKTTLAKAVFNHISNQFKVRCFLLDVWKSVSPGGLRDLQQQLLSQLLGNYQGAPCSVDDGTLLISTRFRNTKVLLILDGMDKRSQLSSLAGKKEWFGPESQIIITTRNIDFLQTQDNDEGTSFQAHSREFEFYEMTEMDSSHALQLFSRHAFEKDSPPADFADIAREISCKTGGLPLVLEALGSSLRSKGLSNWKEMLRKSDRGLLPLVYDTLWRSYDDLEYNQKEIFLDIACFFTTREKLSLCCMRFMWEASGYYPKDGLPALTRRSLIKIVENDKLWMNVQLRNFGREIVAREDLHDPGKRSRLWEPEIALKVIQMQKLTPNVRALRLTGLSKEYNFTSEDFSNVPNLRFLELEGSNLVGDFKNLLSKLTWFSWSNCPSELKATNLCLQQLLVLELSGSNITEDWAGWGPCLVSKYLKVLQITQCPNLRRIPVISKCSKLERLVLQFGETLVVKRFV